MRKNTGKKKWKERKGRIAKEDRKKDKERQRRKIERKRKTQKKVTKIKAEGMNQKN